MYHVILLSFSLDNLIFLLTFFSYHYLYVKFEYIVYKSKFAGSEKILSKYINISRFY